jgi:hypothetical protein
MNGKLIAEVTAEHDCQKAAAQPAESTDSLARRLQRRCSQKATQAAQDVCRRSQVNQYGSETSLGQDQALIAVSQRNFRHLYAHHSIAVKQHDVLNTTFFAFEVVDSTALTDPAHSHNPKVGGSNPPPQPPKRLLHP